MIYFIKGGDFVKIGKSHSPEKRIKELQTGNPYKLELLKTIKECSEGGYFNESDLHIKFKDHRVEGEWFRYTDEIENFILGGYKKVAKSEVKVKKIKDFNKNSNLFVYVDFNKRTLSNYEIGILNAKAKRAGTNIGEIITSFGLPNKALNQEDAKFIKDILNKLLDTKQIKRPNYKYKNYMNTKGKLKK